MQKIGTFFIIFEELSTKEIKNIFLAGEGPSLKVILKKLRN